MHPNIIKECRHSVELLLRDHPELADDAQLRADCIESETDFNETMRKLLGEIDAAEMMAEALTATVLNFKLRQSRLEKRKDKLRETAQSLMQTAGLKKLVLPEGTITVTLKPPEPMRPDSLDGIPEDFLKTKVELDWAAMKAAIKDGKQFDGVRFNNGHAVLTIR